MVGPFLALYTPHLRLTYIFLHDLPRIGVGCSVSGVGPVRMPLAHEGFGTDVNCGLHVGLLAFSVQVRSSISKSRSAFVRPCHHHVLGWSTDASFAIGRLAKQHRGDESLPAHVGCLDHALARIGPNTVRSPSKLVES